LGAQSLLVGLIRAGKIAAARQSIPEIVERFRYRLILQRFPILDSGLIQTTLFLKHETALIMILSRRVITEIEWPEIQKHQQHGENRDEPKRLALALHQHIHDPAEGVRCKDQEEHYHRQPVSGGHEEENNRGDIPEQKPEDRRQPAA